jgi:voltage-gated potassium channel
MADKRFHDWIGLSGVAVHENSRAKLWMKRLELPLLVIAFWILVSWYWESITQKLPYDALLNWTIWLFYTFETVLLSSLVNNRAYYLKNNWLNIVIIVAALPLLFIDTPYVFALRSLRLLVFLSLILQLSKTIRTILSHNHFGHILLISFIFIIVAGYLIASIDPGIKNPAEGIWWAWVTATTVGYGDIVPTSNPGRVLAGFLILLGVSLLSLITANISVYFLSQSKSDSEQQRLRNIEKQLSRIEKLLENAALDKNSQDK